MRQLPARSAAAVAAACMIAVAAMYAYFRAFGFFSPNDDEGYILQSVGSYLAGHRLFDEIFTQYGPAFFVLESVIHQTLRAPLTHDFERFATAGAWVAASAASAATVFRVTRSSIPAGLTFVGVFVHLTPLIGEPGHPQGPLVLVIALVTLIAAWDGEALSPRRATAAGVLTAFALLIKVNVGAYLALGFAVPVLLASRLPRSRSNALLLAMVAAAACALPLLVTRNHVRGWAFNYALITSLSLASTIVVVAWPRRTSLPVGVLVRYVAAAGIACVLLLVPALLRGTSIAALLTGTILRPSQFDLIFFLPLILPASGLVAGGVAVALSVAWVLWLKAGGTPRFLLVAIAKIAVAAAGLYLARRGLGYQIAWFTPFLWVVAVQPGFVSTAPLPVGRSILALVAGFQSLQAYPVAGSQLAFATFLMIPIAFVCAHDALAILGRRLGESRGLSWAFQTSFILAGVLFYRPLLGPFPWRSAYDIGYELRLDGAERLRLPAADVARYHWLSGTVAGNCRALLTLPGLYSFNAWSGVGTVNASNATTWMTLLSDSDQASLWRAVDNASHVCAIYNPTLAANWLPARHVEGLPAHREMTARFREVAESGGYRLLMRDVDIPPAGVVISLVSGRQAFERRRSPLPIPATLAVAPETSTLRAWIRSTRTGVIVGCQSEERAGARLSRWLPMLYIGSTGRLFGQHWTADMQVQTTARAVNDGRWHHVALVKERNDQRLFVDGAAVGSSHSPIETAGLTSCQAGTGATNLWPDGPLGWMPFNGEIDGLVVSRRAWSAAEVADDWRTTQPRE